MVDISAFDAAFAEASKPEDAPTTATSVAALEAGIKSPQGTVPAANPATPPAPEAAAAAPEAAGAASQEPTELEVPAEGETEPEPPKPTPQGGADEDMLKRFAALMAAAQPQQLQQPQPYQSQTPNPPPAYSQAELQQLQAFYNDWPDVAKPVEVMARGMVINAMRSMYADMAGTLAPYLQTINALADHNQLNELTAKVPDYNTVAEQLEPWVNSQPPYLQPAYRHVIEQGTSDEVLDLIERFKRETGSTVQVQQQPSTQGGGRAQPATQTRSVTELSPAAKQAAARLAPISSKRSNAVTAAPVDFDAAFAEFARSV